MEYENVLMLYEEATREIDISFGLFFVLIFIIPLILLGFYMWKLHIKKIKNKKFVTYSGFICNSEKITCQESEGNEYIPVIEYNINGNTYKHTLNVAKNKKGEVKFKCNLYDPNEIMTFAEYYGHFIILLIALCMIIVFINMRLIIYIGIIGGVWGLSILIKEIYKANSNKYLQTEGIVVELHESYRGSEYQGKSEIIEYVVDGKKYYLQSPIASTFYRRKGTICIIKYNPNNPYDSVVKKDWRRTLLVTVGTLCLIVILVILSNKNC